MIDNPQTEQILGSEFKRVRGLFGVLVALPKNAGAAFGTDYRVVREFEYGDAIADTDSQSTAAAPFAFTGAGSGGPLEFEALVRPR